MERENTQIQSPKEKVEVKQRGELDLPPKLEVKNEVPVPPVVFAVKSGCGKCG